MFTRYRGWVRAAAALGVASLYALISPTSAEEPSATPTETVGVLQAQRDGLLEVSLRGQGADRVRVILHNSSPRRLNVVFPPGLVAAATTGQAGGFQSMGLSTPSNTGGFGQFRGASPGLGFRSVSTDGQADAPSVGLGAGQTLDFTVPSVCLNYGLPTPTPRHEFRLVDVDEYTTDARARRALRSLATLGTSQQVAQAVAWHVFNGMSFPQIARVAARYVNTSEVALAARFVEALDSSSSTEIVDPAYFNQGRVFVRISGEGAMQKDAGRLAAELETQSLLGLPIRVVDANTPDNSGPASLFVHVMLNGTSGSAVRARLNARYRALEGGWMPLGQAGMSIDVDGGQLDAARLAEELDRTLAATFVRGRVVRSSSGASVVRIDNRLPFSITGVTLRTGKSEDAGRVTLTELGIAPARSGVATVPAAQVFVERVAANGL